MLPTEVSRLASFHRQPAAIKMNIIAAQLEQFTQSQSRIHREQNRGRQVVAEVGQGREQVFPTCQSSPIG
jgi:hypothetical protein